MFFFLLNVCRFVELKVDKNNNGLYFVLFFFAILLALNLFLWVFRNQRMNFLTQCKLSVAKFRFRVIWVNITHVALFLPLVDN